MGDYIAQFVKEVVQKEEISRKTDIRVEPPTLKNIFRNDRQVKVHYTGAAKE